MSDKKSIHFIVNPVSGFKNNEDMLSIIKDNLDHSKFEFDFTYTKARGHATEIATQAVNDNVDIVAAVGGDGTVNEVSAPLVHTDSALAIIPNGSGNGFAMHIGMGRSSKKAVKLLNESVELCIDTCTVNGAYFLNLAGIGFDALIAYKADQGKTKRGFQMYASLVTKELTKFKAMDYKLVLDKEEINGAYTVVAIANAAMYGYNFNVAPQAKLTDGLFDVVLIKDAPLIRTLCSSWRLLNKSIAKSSLVEVKRSKEVRLSLEESYYYHVDGESRTFDSELHFKVIPKSLNIIIPTSKSQAV